MIWGEPLFTAHGGAVIENDPAWAWSDPAGNDAAAPAFRAALVPYVGAAPVRVTGGPTGRYPVSYRRGGRLVVAVTNHFSWVQIRWKKGEENPAAPPAKGMRVTWRKGNGCRRHGVAFIDSRLSRRSPARN